MAHLALIGISALQLFLAAAALFTVGFLLTRLLGPYWFSERLSPAHLVAAGQLVVVLEFYLRSFLNHLIGHVVPITALDVAALLVVLILLVQWKEGVRETGRVLWESRVELALFALVAVTLFFIITRNELPRVVMLSSDADQHAFWARQVERFRTLPYFHQFWWGDVGFEYPGGFAILNYLWMSLSGLEARQIVTVQTLLQVQIAILTLLETLRGGEFERPWRTLVAVFLCFLVYYQLLSYGYELPHYFLQAAGRTGSMLFAALPLSFLLFALERHRGNFARDLPIAPQAQLLGLSALVAGWINVVNLPYVLALSAGGLCSLLVTRPTWRRSFAALLLLVPLPLILIDPYYMKRLLFHDPGRAMVGEPVSLLPLSALPGRWGEAVALWAGQAIQFASDFFQTDLLSDWGRVFVWAILSVSVVVLGLRWRRRTAASVGIVLVVLFAIRALVFPLTEALAQFGPDYYLLSKYVDMSREQFLILILYACVALLAIELAKKLSPLQIVGLILAIVLFSFAAPNTEIGPRHRQSRAGTLGRVTGRDLTVIREVESLFHDWRSDHPVLDSGSVPRILIPNGAFQVGRENWLFPFGASRVLPFADVFPVAFFYFEGSREYTFEAYLEHVCTRFDAEWLLAHNIQYLFLPEDRKLICVAGLDSVVASAHAVAREGNAELLEISSQVPR